MTTVFSPSTSVAVAIGAGGEVSLGPVWPACTFTLPPIAQSFTIHNPKPHSILGTLAAPSTHIVFCTTRGRTKATVTATFNSAGVVDETIIIEGRTYTQKATVGATADQFLIAATASETAANFAAMINCNTAHAGRYGSATTVNLHVSATVSGAVVTLTALVGGTAGNSIDTTETGSSVTFSAATLTGGANDEDVDGGVPITILTPLTRSYSAGAPPTYYLHCAEAVDVTIELHGV